MRYLRQLGSQFSIPIPADDEGYLGRDCPECDLPCHCPCCGHSAHRLADPEPLAAMLRACEKQ